MKGMRPRAWDDYVSTAWELAEEIRWGADGPRCPTCKERDPYLLLPRGVYKCKKCKKQYTPFSGTILASTKIPFSAIVYAVERIVLDDASPITISRELMVNYRTAHSLCRKTREVMCVMDVVEGTEFLSGAQRPRLVVQFMLQSPDVDKDFFQKRIGRRHSEITAWSWSGRADMRRRLSTRRVFADLKSTLNKIENLECIGDDLKAKIVSALIDVISNSGRASNKLLQAVNERKNHET